MTVFTYGEGGHTFTVAPSAGAPVDTGALVVTTAGNVQVSATVAFQAFASMTTKVTVTTAGGTTMIFVGRVPFTYNGVVHYLPAIASAQ